MKKASIEGDLGRHLDDVEGCQIDRHDAQRTVRSRSEPGIEDWKSLVSILESIGTWRSVCVNYLLCYC